MDRINHDNGLGIYEKITIDREKSVRWIKNHHPFGLNIIFIFIRRVFDSIKAYISTVRIHAMGTKTTNNFLNRMKKIDEERLNRHHTTHSGNVGVWQNRVYCALCWIDRLLLYSTALYGWLWLYSRVQIPINRKCHNCLAIFSLIFSFWKNREKKISKKTNTSIIDVLDDNPHQIWTRFDCFLDIFSFFFFLQLGIFKKCHKYWFWPNKFNLLAFVSALLLEISAKFAIFGRTDNLKRKINEQNSLDLI